MKNNHKPIGLLYDSISNNTGDIAIGVAISEQLSRLKIKHEVVYPFEYRAKDYEFLIVGGGFLLREPGDFYYDNFRPEGAHFLNAMGVSASRDLGYLKDYRSVTVRSSEDKKRILSVQPDVEVKIIPCTTMLMTPDTSLAKKTEGKVGVQFVADTLRDCPGFENVINEIKHAKATLPFTHYNFDASVMRQANLVGDYLYLEEYDPRKIMGLIGSMKYVIVSSLHATIFAYTQNIPFLSFQQSKVEEFLKDRGLEHLIFRNAGELRDKIKHIEKHRPDFSDLIEKDKKSIHRHFNEVFKKYIGSHENETAIDIAPLEAREKYITRVKALDHSLRLSENVIAHRDMLIGELIQRNVKLESDLEAAKKELGDYKDRFQKISGTVPYKAYKITKRILKR